MVKSYLPTSPSNIKGWQARRDCGQKCRRAHRDRSQIGGEPAVTAVILVASPPRLRQIGSEPGRDCAHFSGEPTETASKWWRAHCNRGQKCRRACRTGGIAD